jgi:hypothetical protein
MRHKFIEVLEANNIAISIDVKGRATDYAITERFSRSIKSDLLHINEYRCWKQARGYNTLF